VHSDYLFIFFFFDMSTQEGGGGIRTSDLHFMKRGPNRLNYFLGTHSDYYVYLIYIIIRYAEAVKPDSFFFFL
jgi:hypothetical protein